MPSAHSTWQPMLVAEPAAFRRILAQPVLETRLRAWPGFGDMLLGESLRHGHRPDPQAMDVVRELYAFGLNNGLSLRERLHAAEALRQHLAGRGEGVDAWEAFLHCDPAPEVVMAAAEGRLENDAGAAAALCAVIENRGCQARGAILAALLRRGVSELFALAAPLRHTLDLLEVAQALGCCEAEPLPAASQAFLADWLDSVDAAEEPELADLLAQGITRQRTATPDIRRMADHFLPGEAAAHPILRAASSRPRRRRAHRGDDLQA